MAEHGAGQRVINAAHSTEQRRSQSIYADVLGKPCCADGTPTSLGSEYSRCSRQGLQHNRRGTKSVLPSYRSYARRRSRRCLQQLYRCTAGILRSGQPDAAAAPLGMLLPELQELLPLHAHSDDNILLPSVFSVASVVCFRL